MTDLAAVQPQPQKAERIGVAVVHGIGEQRRFEHIDGQVRAIVAALRARPGAQVTVEIVSADAGAFMSERDAWRAGATVRVMVVDPAAKNPVHIYFHEVWWADVNEPYSLSKQIRFWSWGLSMWLYPDKVQSMLATADYVIAPHSDQMRTSRQWRVLGARFRLFLVAAIAVLGAASIGMFTFLAERVFNLKPPRFVQTFVNYLSGVKLYNQRHRYGIGLLPPKQDFLDTMGEPPRVSVRRRMIRTIMDMGEKGYERWYILAHSLGSIAAFNGLMETAFAWPGYFEEKQWNQAKLVGFAGPAETNWFANVPKTKTVPARPTWVRPDDIAYRSKIFAGFHGLLTFGSPLEKFATIWPARAPVTREPAFRGSTEWINVYDPMDPVSGVLESFDGPDVHCCPKVRNVGYASGSIVLLNHIQYLSDVKHHDGLADGVAEWLITGSSQRISPAAGRRWYEQGSSRQHLRSLLGWASWAVVFALLTLAATLVAPTVLAILRDLLVGLGNTISQLFLHGSKTALHAVQRSHLR